MFAQEDVDKGTGYGLGPAYFDARRVCENFMSKFENEQFKPLVDKLADQINERLWEDLQSSLLMDTEINLQGEIYRMVDNCVEALLSGQEWAIKKYVLGQYNQEKLREAVAKHITVELQDARIKDLEAELKRVKDDLAWHRQR